MTEPTAAHARDLGDYLAVARRRWGWIVCSVLLGTTLAMGYLVSAEKTYVSTAKVLVLPTGTSEGSALGARTNGVINLDTEAQLVKSEAVSSRAGQILRSSLSPVALASRVSVAVPANTTVMNISFAAPTAEEAQDGASAYAKAYLENRRDVAESALSGDIDRLRDQIRQTTEQIQETSVSITRLNKPRDRDDRAFLVARRATLSNQLGSFNAQLAPLMATVVDAGKVIQAAQLPLAPADPDPMLVLPTGLMAGLMLGFGVAGLRERADKRIHDARDVERLFGIVPLTAVRAGRHPSFGRVVHDVRALYHSLLANLPGGAGRIAVIGPDGSGTADLLGYGLVLVAGRSGTTAAMVTRIDAPLLDGRQPSLAERRGLLRITDYGKLGVIDEGEVRASALRTAVHELATHREVVVLGLPHDDPEVDVPLLGRSVEVGLVVVRLGETQRDRLGAVLADLSKSGVQHVFVVVVDLGRQGVLRRRADADAAFAAATDRTEAEGASKPAAQAAPAAGANGRADQPVPVPGPNGGPVEGSTANGNAAAAAPATTARRPE